MTDARDRDGAPGPPAHPYDREYFESYHSDQGPVAYDRKHPQWLEFFSAVADHIAMEIKPARVLDVGCAKGFLVEALRDRGVEAFGIDISEYAIGEVRSDIQPYCRVASATEAFDDHYDLITCIEVLEHLSEDDGQRAIANICRSTTDVLFSSTPDDFTEPTHVNVRPCSWWIERFAQHGFQLDVEFDAGFVAAHAMRFRAHLATGSPLDPLLAQRHHLLRQLAALRIDVDARDGTIGSLQATIVQDRDVIAALEQERDRSRQALETKDGLMAALQQEYDRSRQAIETKDGLIADLEAAGDRLRGDIAAEQRRAEALHDELTVVRRSSDEKDELIAGLNYHLLAVQRTIGWKVLGRLRRVRDRLLPPDSRRRDLYWPMRRAAEVLLDEGVRAFFRKTEYKVRLRWQGQDLLVKPPPSVATAEDPGMQYQLWLQRHRLGPRDVTRMKSEVKTFAYTPVISIVTPVYNTDEVWLRKAIESVRAQIYPHWELGLVDDGSTRPHVRAILDEYVAIEPRLWVEHLPRSQGITGASSHGLRLATGDFVALLDHDDELAPEALFEVVKRLNETPDLDLIYTDEDKLDPDGERVEPFFKPDWSPDLLMSMNYITHLSVFRRSLLGEIGGFRPGLDGSQDYDLLLRFSERARGIAHIPQILYHWRKVPGSAAADPTAKPFAYEAGRRAIEDAVRRRGHEAQVASVQPGLYSVRYALRATPLVSIIVSTRDRWSLLRECLRSIEEKTRYPRYEIIVLDNDSAEPETRAGLSAIAGKWQVHPYPGAFNFSAINNFGAAKAHGEHLVFLNNDTQVIEGDWLAAMLEHAQRPEVGAVGARLHYPDGRIQHAGVVLGVGGVADHAFKGLPGDASTYFFFGNVVRNCSAVTAACMMVPRRAFEEIEGFDERLPVALNDVDLCLRLRQRGYLIVYTPFALLYHHESGTRGGLYPPKDDELVWGRWGEMIRKGDPYYNPNLTLSRTDWSLRS